MDIILNKKEQELIKNISHQQQILQGRLNDLVTAFIAGRDVEMVNNNVRISEDGGTITIDDLPIETEVTE